MGLDADVANIDYGTTAENVLREALTRRSYDVVVGGGVRFGPALTHLLEMCVNVCRKLAPRSVLAFNTGPATTAEAVARWYPQPTPVS